MDFKNQYSQFISEHEFDEELPEWCPSMCEVDMESLQKIMESQSKKLLKLQLESCIFKNKKIQNIYTKRKMEINRIKEESKEWIFITINPKPGIELDDFKNKIQSITKWKCFYKGFYVLEQRGESYDDMGRLPHAHIMLCKYNVERKRLIKRLEATFKNYCNPPYENTINVLRKSQEHGKETLEEYMKGDKQDDKLDKVNFDKIWRKENNIDDIYFWDTTTDKVSQKKPADGRVNNGGNRVGAGRKKKVISIISEDKKEDKIKWGEKVTLTF